MTIFGIEVGFVSTDRKVVDFLAQVFELQELPSIVVDEEIIEQFPAAEPATQYRLQARDGAILKVTVPQAATRKENITDSVLAGTGLRYVTLYVSDLAGVVARAREMGGWIEQEPTNVMGGQLALVQDPDGNRYELSEVPV